MNYAIRLQDLFKRPLTSWFIIMLLMGLSLVVGSYLVYQTEVTKAEVAAREVAHSNEILSRNLFADLDRLIEDMASRYLSSPTPEQYWLSEQILRQRKKTNPLIMDLLILDATGEVLIWSGEGAAPDVRQRDYYRHHQTNPHSLTYVTPPQLSLVHEGKWFFSISRAIRTTDGRLQGIGVAIMSIDALEKNFSILLEGSDLSVSLIHQQGKLLLRSPKVAYTPGEDITHLANISLPIRQPTTLKLTGLDGKPRVVSLRPLSSHPLVVTGAANLDTALASWRNGSLVGLMAWLIFGVLSYWGAQKLNRSHQREKDTQAIYQQLFENVSDAIFLLAVEWTDNDYRFRYLNSNPAHAKGTGLATDRLSGRQPAEVLPPETAAAVSARYTSCIEQRSPQVYEEELLLPAGKRTWMTILNPVFDDQGRVSRILGVTRDITQQSEFTRHLKDLTRNLPGFVYQLQMEADGSMHYAYASEGISRLFGVSAEQVMADARILLDMIHPEDYQRIIDESIASATQGKDWHGIFRMIHPDGGLRWIEARDTPQQLDNGAIRWTGYVNDITERKQIEAEMAHMAHYDILTDLPNRAFFFEMVQRSLNLAKRQRGRVALLFVDLDRFKPVNDEYGHTVGDILLQQVARRMTDCLREADMVARIGGDEFVILLHRIEQDNDALLTAEKIRQQLGVVFEIEGHILHISCSIGVALYPEHGETITDLTRHADLAMYQAKQAGRDNVKLFDTERQDH